MILGSNEEVVEVSSQPASMLGMGDGSLDENSSRLSKDEPDKVRDVWICRGINIYMSCIKIEDDLEDRHYGTIPKKHEMKKTKANDILTVFSQCCSVTFTHSKKKHHESIKGCWCMICGSVQCIRYDRNEGTLPF